MRQCVRCGAEMEEDYTLTSGYGIVIRKGRFSEKPKAAVCPRCGEISLYVEDVEKLKK